MVTKGDGKADYVPYSTKMLQHETVSRASQKIGGLIKTDIHIWKF